MASETSTVHLYVINADRGTHRRLTSPVNSRPGRLSARKGGATPPIDVPAPFFRRNTVASMGAVNFATIRMAGDARPRMDLVDGR